VLRTAGRCWDTSRGGLASVIGIGPEDLLADGRIEDTQAPDLEWLRRRGLEPGGDVRGHRAEALCQHAGQEAGLALADSLLDSERLDGLTPLDTGGRTPESRCTRVEPDLPRGPAPRSPCTRLAVRP
jgi:hypothetical protein